MNKLGPNDYWKQVRTDCVVREAKKYLPDLKNSFPERTWYSYVMSEYRLSLRTLQPVLKTIENNAGRKKKRAARRLRLLLVSGPDNCELWKALDARTELDSAVCAWRQAALRHIAKRRTGLVQRSTASKVEAAQAHLAIPDALLQSALLVLTRAILSFRIQFTTEREDHVERSRVLAARSDSPKAHEPLTSRRSRLLSQLALGPCTLDVSADHLVRRIRSTETALSDNSIDYRDILWCIQNLVAPVALPTSFRLRKDDEAWREMTIGKTEDTKNGLFPIKHRRRRDLRADQDNRATKIVERMIDGWPHAKRPRSC